MSMQAILAASQSMARMQSMQSARTQIQGTANVLRAESKQDGGNKMKEEQADKLEEKSTQLMNNLMSEANNVQETLKPDEDVSTETDAKAEPTEKTEKQPRSDTLALSKDAAKLIGETSPVKTDAVEAVTYKANGKAVSNAPAKNAHAFKATA